MSSSIVDAAYSNENSLDRSKWLDILLQAKNVSILIFVGEYDLSDGPTDQEPWIKLLHEFTKNYTVNSKFWN